jgi:hypothetical protein
VAKKPTITEKIMFTQEKAAAFSCVNCRTFNGKMKGERKKCTLLVAKTCTFLIAKSCTLLFTVYILMISASAQQQVNPMSGSLLI